MLNTIATVLLTLCVTYLANSITSSMKKRNLIIGTYIMIQNMILVDRRNLKALRPTIVECEAIENMPHGNVYSSSIFDHLQICEIVPAEVHYQILDSCERYNNLRYNTIYFTESNIIELLATLEADFKFFSSELEKAKKTSWFYYWKKDFIHLLTGISR